MRNLIFDDLYTHEKINFMVLMDSIIHKDSVEILGVFFGVI